MKTTAIFLYSLFAAVMVHVLAMVLGLLALCLLLGKVDEGPLMSIVCVHVPFFCAAAFLRHRRIRWPHIVSPASAVLIVAPFLILAFLELSPDLALWLTLGPLAVACSFAGDRIAAQHKVTIDNADSILEAS